jgi:hypothetical protein
MRYFMLLLAVAVLATPACQSIPVQPKAKLVVEAPGDLKQVNYKVEVALN